MRKLLFFFIYLYSLSNSIAQTTSNLKELVVKQFEELPPTSLEASTSACLDANGIPCGLIKVYIPSIKEATFTGDIIKKEYNAGEYLLYIPENTQSLVISHPSCKTLTLDFKKHNIEIFPKTSYLLILQFGGNNGIIKPGKGNVKIESNPTDKDVLLDGIYYGRTPIHLPNVARGSHSLAIGSTFYTNIMVKEGVENKYKYKINDNKEIYTTRAESDNGLIGIRNRDNGEIIIPAVYSAIKPDPYDGYNDVYPFYAVKKNNRWGLIDRNGQEKLPFIYDKIFDFAYIIGGDEPDPLDFTMLIAMKDGKYGCIDITTGKESVSCKFDFILGFENRNRYSSAKIDGGKCYIDRTGSIVEVPESYSQSKDFNLSVDETGSNLSAISKSGRTGFADKNGNIIIPVAFQTPHAGYGANECFYDGFCFLGINNKYAIFDETGKQMTKFIYEKFLDFQDGIAYAKEINGGWKKITRSQLIRK